MSDLKYPNSLHYETVDMLLNSAPGDFIPCKKTDNNYEVLLPRFLLADFFKNNRRPAVSVPCGAERRGNHKKLKGS